MTAIAQHGMVTTPHYLASQAALERLKQGANAIDAAIVAASVLTVVYPHMNSIGGDNFWLIYNAKKSEVKAINASGRASENASISFYTDKGFQVIPTRGYLAANTVPGALSGWHEAHTFSQNELQNAFSWQELLGPAISLAREGFPVSLSLEKWIAINTDVSDVQNRFLQRFDGFQKNFLKNGKPYRQGDMLKLSDLANTLEKIAQNGVDIFYRGEIAQKIVSEIKANGGLLSLHDFSSHSANWVEPLHTPYRDYEAYNLPPNTQGFASLEILNILNHFDLSKIKEGSADYYHLLVEATKEAFLDRDHYLTDPDFSFIPTELLLSFEHGKKQAKRIDLKKAKHPNQLLDPKGDTIWLGVVDQYGNAVSLIQSIYHDFGSGIIPEGTGVILQNRGSFFSLDANHVNCLYPKKRTFHTLNAAMLLKNKIPRLIYGTMGGEGQPQTQAALATRIMDYNMPPQEAIAAPRWVYGRTWGEASNSLKIESRVSQDIIDELKKKGHQVDLVEAYSDIMGHAGAIFIDEKGTKFGGTDPRSDGLAKGY